MPSAGSTATVTRPLVRVTGPGGFTLHVDRVGQGGGREPGPAEAGDLVLAGQDASDRGLVQPQPDLGVGAGRQPGEQFPLDLLDRDPLPRLRCR